jgi:hypothetical protein
MLLQSRFELARIAEQRRRTTSCSEAGTVGILAPCGDLVTPTVHSVAASSVARLDRPERFGRGSFRVTYLTLKASFLRKISCAKYFVPDFLFSEAAARCMRGPSHVGTMQIAIVAGITMKLSEGPN